MAEIPRSTVSYWVFLCLLGGVTACNGGGGDGATNSSASVTPGTLSANPDTGLLFVATAHQHGNAASLRLREVSWGRLVDVYDFDPLTGESQLVMDGAVIDPMLSPVSQDYELETGSIDGTDVLRVLYPRSSDIFRSTLLDALAGLQPLTDQDPSVLSLSPWTAVPRNAALVLHFNDLLDASTVHSETVQLFTGYAPVDPFQARILPDSTRGNVVDGVFHSTSVIVDSTVSESEALVSGMAVQMSGLPEAITTAQPNLSLRVPSAVTPLQGQSEILRSLGGHALDASATGSAALNAPVPSVVRTFRSRGRTTQTGDPDNGYLLDPSAPYIVGNHASHVTFVGPATVAGQYLIDVQFDVHACAPAAREDDLVQLSSGHVLRVIQGPAAAQGGLMQNVRAQLLSGNPNTLAPSSAKYANRYLGTPDQSPPCYVSFAPAAGGAPNTLVATNAKAVVRFNEPIDPNSVRPLDTFTVKYGTPVPSAIYSRVVGDILPDNGLKMMVFIPRLPLQHTQGSATSYAIEVLAGANGVRDLAGNPLAVGLQSSFTIDPTHASIDSASVALRFNSTDEDADGFTEIRGGVLYDLQLQRVVPRAVARFSAVADAPNPVVAAMAPLSQGVVTPLSRYGSRSAQVWRYHDVGFSLRDSTTHDLDVEGLHWSPFGGATSPDAFAQFEMALAHSKFLPDEQLSSGLLPNWPVSGVTGNFAGNALDPIGDPVTVVHPRAKGYTINPSDAFTAINGSVMTPWPLNRGVPQSEYQYWTWRDTSKLALGGPSGAGADTRRLQQVTGVAQPGFYPAAKVPTIGLPLLMEFRAWPDSQAVASNSLRVAIAINSSARPFFRAHSTGGVNPNNPAQTKLVDPDNEPNATGSFGPLGPGTSSPLDNVFAYGQADFVVRVSRMHTRWFDTGAASTTYADPYVELGAALPAGAQVVVAVRGASSITVNNPPFINPTPYTDAANMDSYGDGYTAAQLVMLGLPSGLAFTPVFVNQPADPLNRSWKSSIGAITGARYVQARVSFLSNAETGLGASLSALGFAYRR